MIWSPDLWITAGRQHLPMLSQHSGGRAIAPTYRPAPHSQWRDRVGLSPTSQSHQEASNCSGSITGVWSVLRQRYVDTFTQ